MSKLCCTHCGATPASVKHMLELNNGMRLCDGCADLVHDFMEDARADDADKSKRSAAAARTMTPKSIVAFLNQYVIGQTSAKESLALAVYNHYKRLNNTDTEVELDKSNVLLIGPTGTGKTLLARSVARLLDVPFTIADATSLTQAGYVGDDVETILQRLIQAAGGDVARAERGIVFIDEVDKLAKASAGPSVTRDVSGEGVQQSLLKIIEGSRVSVPVSGNRKTPGAEANFIETKNILFVCGGAFAPLLARKKKPKSRASIGFTAQAPKPADVNEDITPEDLFQFGLIPEFVGRLPIIATLDELRVEDIERILVEPKNSLVRQLQHLLGMDQADLVLDDGALVKIAAQALKLKTGARGARSVLERLLKPAMLQVPEMPQCLVRVTADLEVDIVPQSGKYAANADQAKVAA